MSPAAQQLSLVSPLCDHIGEKRKKSQLMYSASGNCAEVCRKFPLIFQHSLTLKAVQHKILVQAVGAGGVSATRELMVCLLAVSVQVPQ